MINYDEIYNLSRNIIDERKKEAIKNSAIELPKIIEYIENRIKDLALNGEQSLVVSWGQLKEAGFLFYNIHDDIMKHFTTIGFVSEYIKNINPDNDVFHFMWYKPKR